MVACGADDADAAVAGGGDRAAHRGQDHLDDGHVVALAGIAQARRRRRVAGDHQRLDAAVDQVVADGQRVRADLGNGERTVGAVGGVADVDDVLVGQLVDDRARDRQSADAGVEDPDGRRVRELMRQVRVRRAGLASLARLAFRTGQQIRRRRRRRSHRTDGPATTPAAVVSPAARRAGRRRRRTAPPRRRRSPTPCG